MNRFRNFMVGRYGGDALGIGIIVVYFLLALINTFVGLPVLLAMSYALIIVWAMRFFSRNIYKRQAENRKFLKLIAPFQTTASIIKRSFKEKDRRFFKCPNCKQVVRVPKGKGKIAITCPKCRHEFVKRT